MSACLDVPEPDHRVPADWAAGARLGLFVPPVIGWLGHDYLRLEVAKAARIELAPPVLETGVHHQMPAPLRRSASGREIVRPRDPLGVAPAFAARIAGHWAGVVRSFGAGLPQPSWADQSAETLATRTSVSGALGSIRPPERRTARPPDPMCMREVCKTGSPGGRLPTSDPNNLGARPEPHGLLSAARVGFQQGMTVAAGPHHDSARDQLGLHATGAAVRCYSDRHPL